MVVTFLNGRQEVAYIIRLDKHRKAMGLGEVPIEVLKLVQENGTVLLIELLMLFAMIPLYLRNIVEIYLHTYTKKQCNAKLIVPSG